MLHSHDLLHLPYTPDLTEGGIAYALLLLQYNNPSYEQLHRTVAGTIVELAFRRYLSQQDIPFDITAAMPFTDPARYDVSLGGHRCDVKTHHISRRSQITEVRRDPDILLKASALVPSENYFGDGHSDHDLLVFAFLLGLTATSQSDLKKVVDANRPHYLLHVTPKKWRTPFHWKPLRALVLKSESDEEMLVEIIGQDQGRGSLKRLLNLPPKTCVAVNDPFYSVTALHVKNIPLARLGIHSPAHKETHLIQTLDWKNIWVYGMDITLTGYLTRGEFRQRAKSVATNSRLFDPEKNLVVPVSELNPLPDLFTRVREWESQQKNQPT
jgi:hypothetical protein